MEPVYDDYKDREERKLGCTFCAAFLAFLLTLIVLIMLSLCANGAWGAPSEPVGSRRSLVAVKFEPEPRYEWKPSPTRPNQIDLFKNGVQVGGYDLVERQYYAKPLRQGGWWEKSEPPIAPPGPGFLGRVEADGTVNQGLQVEKLTPLPAGDSLLRVGNQEYRGDDALRLIEGNRASPLGDDSAKPWVVIWDKDAGRRRRIVDDLKQHPKLAPFREKIKVQDADPSGGFAWAAKPYKLDQDVEFQRSGLAILFTAAGTDRAKALHAVYDYGPDGPEQVYAGLRKIVPDYDPNKVPPRGPSGEEETGVPWWILLVAGGAIVIKRLKG